MKIFGDFLGILTFFRIIYIFWTHPSKVEIKKRRIMAMDACAESKLQTSLICRKLTHAHNYCVGKFATAKNVAYLVSASSPSECCPQVPTCGMKLARTRYYFTLEVK